jgi:hypothetical protein
MSRLYKVRCRVQRKNLVGTGIITEYKIDDETSTSSTLSQLTNWKHTHKANAKEDLLCTTRENFDAQEQTL